MKRISTVIVAFLFVVSSVGSQVSVAATPATPQSLATKISKSGLGCKSILEKTKMLLNGTRWNCLVGGENISIEVYPSKAWKSVIKMACSFDIGFIAITDNKTWIVTAESRVTANKLKKPLGGTLKVFCNSKNVINETKIDFSEKPDSSLPTPSPTPSLGSWTAPFSFNTSVKDSGFIYQPISIETGITIKVCADSSKREQDFPDNYDYGVTGELCPQSESKYSADRAKLDDYAKFTFEYKNETDKINYPGSFSVFFKIADSQGKIYSTVLISYEDSKSLSIDAVPGASIKSHVYFQLPKTFKKEGAKLEMDFLNGKPFYWLIP